MLVQYAWRDQRFGERPAELPAEKKVQRHSCALPGRTRLLLSSDTHRRAFRCLPVAAGRGIPSVMLDAVLLAICMHEETLELEPQSRFELFFRSEL